MSLVPNIDEFGLECVLTSASVKKGINFSRGLKALHFRLKNLFCLFVSASALFHSENRFRPSDFSHVTPFEKSQTKGEIPRKVFQRIWSQSCKIYVAVTKAKLVLNSTMVHYSNFD